MTRILYRIRDWERHFENNRTRELKRMLWVPVPTKQDGDGYTELLDHPQGAAHYGAWVALIAVAAKSTPRGSLVRDCAEKLRRACDAPAILPHNEYSLARVTRIAASVFKAAIPRLVEIGWLEAITIEATTSYENPAGGCGAPAAAPQVARARDTTEQDITEQGMEWNGKTQHNMARADCTAAFERFWSAFPAGRKKSKGLARAAWDKAIKKIDAETIIAAAIEYKASDEGRGAFVKMPSTWLNQDCWTDERAAWADKSATDDDPRGTKRQMQTYLNMRKEQDERQGP